MLLNVVICWPGLIFVGLEAGLDWGLSKLGLIFKIFNKNLYQIGLT